MGTFHHSLTNGTNWLTEGPIGTYAESYNQYLVERKYAASTVRRYLSSIAHFSQWARSKRCQVHQISESSVAEFLDTHLPSCCCVKPAHRERSNLSAALGHLLIVLRARRAIA